MIRNLNSISQRERGNPNPTRSNLTTPNRKMPAEKYLCHVNSGAITPVTPSLWRDFYTTEHLPDVVNSTCAVRALLYEEITTPFPATMTVSDNNPRDFLAVYQTQYAELMRSPCHDRIRTASEMFREAGSTTDLINRNGDFDVRNYELIQEYDPRAVGETPSPQLLTVETQPTNALDYDNWYREEHLSTLRHLPGYRRSLRYKIGAASEFAQSSPPGFLALHEVDDIAAFAGEEEGGTVAVGGGSTPWTSRRQLANCEKLVVRGWKLVMALGY